MGVTVSLGSGSVTGIVKKCRINTKSSTEAELNGAKNAMPQMLLGRTEWRPEVS